MFGRKPVKQRQSQELPEEQNKYMNAKQSLRVKRVARIRSKVTGTAARPRVVVYRSNRALSVQVVDDTKHVTLVAARVSPSNKTTANVLGEDIAKKMKDKGITTIVFDR